MNLINNRITIKIDFIDFIINNKLFFIIKIIIRMFISINNNRNKLINTFNNQILNFINYFRQNNFYKSSFYQTRSIRYRRIVYNKNLKIIKDFQKEMTKIVNFNNNLNFIQKRLFIRFRLMKILN